MDGKKIKEKNNGKIIGTILLVIAILTMGTGVYLLLSNDNAEISKVEVDMNLSEVRTIIDDAYDKTNSLNSVEVDMSFVVTTSYEGATMTMGIDGYVQSDNVNGIVYSYMNIDMFGMQIPMEMYTVAENDSLYTYTYTEDAGWSKTEGEGTSLTVDASELFSVIDDQEFTVEKIGDDYIITIMIEATELNTGTDTSSLEGVFVPMTIEIEDEHIKKISVFLEDEEYKIDMKFDYINFNKDFNLELPSEALSQ